MKPHLQRITLFVIIWIATLADERDGLWQKFLIVTIATLSAYFVMRQGDKGE